MLLDVGYDFGGGELVVVVGVDFGEVFCQVWYVLVCFVLVELIVVVGVGCGEVIFGFLCDFLCLCIVVGIGIQGQGGQCEGDGECSDEVGGMCLYVGFFVEGEVRLQVVGLC